MLLDERKGEKIMKKYIAFVLICVIILGYNIQTYAMENETQSMVAVIEDEEKYIKIDKLFAERCKLEVEFEENKDLIEQIDEQLKSLGVEEITEDDVRSIRGQNIVPCVSESSTSDTKWTSTRMIVAYANKQYELQIVEGVPRNSSSPLRKDDVGIEYQKSGFVAGAVNAIKVVGATALGAAPEIGPVLGAGVTAYDIFNAFIEGLSPTTIIENVSGSALVSFSSHMKFIYVKPSGSTDFGNQILCYAGSRVDYTVTTVSVVDELINGVSTPVHNVTDNKTDYSMSKNYSNYSLAAQNYYNYKTNGNNNFIYDYHLTYVTINIFGYNMRFTVPSAYPNIS